MVYKGISSVAFVLNRSGGVTGSSRPGSGFNVIHHVQVIIEAVPLIQRMKHMPPSPAHQAIYEAIYGMTAEQLAYRCWRSPPVIKAPRSSQRYVYPRHWQDEKSKCEFFYQPDSIHLQKQPWFTQRSENINGRDSQKQPSVCDVNLGIAGISNPS